MAMPSIQGQCDTSTMHLSRGLDIGLIKWTERHWHGSKDPQVSSNSSTSKWSTSLGQSQASRLDVSTTEGRGEPEASRLAMAELPELFWLKCAGHYHKGNTDTNALQTEQFLVCRVTSRYNHRFSDRTSIPRTKASPEILQPYILQYRHSSYYNKFKVLLQVQTQ